MITALNNRIASCEPKPTQFLKVTLATGTAVQASATSVPFTAATFYGYKTITNNAAPVANGADAYLGYVDSAGTLVTAGQPAIIDTVGKGSYLQQRAPAGTKYDLKDIYFLGTTGDFIIIAYEA